MTKKASDVFDDLEKYIYQPQPTPYDNLINMGFRYEYEEMGDDFGDIDLWVERQLDMLENLDDIDEDDED